MTKFRGTSRHPFSASIATLALVLFSLAAAHAAPLRLEMLPRSVVVSVTRGASAELSLDAPAGVQFLAETSFGSLSTVEEKSPGHYVARLSAPPADMPRTAVVILSPQGRDDADLAWALLPVRVTTTLTARTEPRARVTARVGAAEFGPVEAARDGSFTLSMQLAPGDSVAEIRITDGAGNVTTSSLPVPVRSHDPLTVTLDKYRVPSDGTATARVFALAFDQAGRPIPNARLSAVASTGSLSAFEDRGDGVHVARWTPPTDGSAGIATIDVSLVQAGVTHREGEQVSIVRGRPSALTLAADPTEVEAGAGTAIRLVATLHDAAGHGLPGEPLRMVADRGSLADVVDKGDGTYESKLVAPSAVESGSIEVKALLATASPAKPPARIELTATPSVVPTSWRAFSLVTAKLFDADGLPVAGELVLFHLARGEGRLTPVSVSLDEGQALADFTADPTEESVTIEATSTSVPSLKARVEIEKRSTGEFAIITRPSQVAHGGQGSASIDLAGGERVLEATVLIGVRAGAPARLVATAEPSRLRADGIATATITALLTDERGNEILAEKLAWSADRGLLEPATSDGEGGYDATFTAPDGAGSGAASITVTHPGSGLSATVSLGLDVGPPRNLALALDPTSLNADGASSARVTATLTDASGVPVPGEDVDFSIASGDASVDPSAATNGAGQAIANVLAGSSPGSVTIDASAEGGALSASAKLELLALGPARLEIAASPDSIVADGRARSEISAHLEDALGNPLEGEVVEFTTSAGTLTTRQARSDATGIARVYLSSELPGSANVLARSMRVSSLSDTISVTLRPIGALSASFSVAEPTCSSAVLMTATSPLAQSWQWEWTGDGQADGATASVSAALPPGTTSVTLTVTDSSGHATTSTRDVIALASPAAHAMATPAAASSGASVLLDGGTSSAADGTPLAFDWDLNADGVADAHGATTSWSAPDGQHVATLTATDSAGCTAKSDIAVVFGQVPDLAVDVSITSGSRLVSAGETVEFEISWRNEGTIASSGVLIDVTFDNIVPIAPIPAGAAPRPGGGLEFSLGTIAAGASGSFRVRGQTDATFGGASVTGALRAVISGWPADLDNSDNSGAAFLTITRKVDLVVSLEAPASVRPGEPLVATITVRNVTAADATDVEAAIEWDEALLLSPVLDMPTTAMTSPILVSLGTIAGGDTRSIRLSGTIPSIVATTDPILALSASAWHAGSDADPASNTDARNVNIPAQPNLAVSLAATVATSPLGPGGIVEYLATFRNDGPAPALGVTLTHSFTPDLIAALTSNPDRGVLSGSNVTFDLGSVPPRSPGIRRFTARLSQDIDPSVRSLLDTCEIVDAARTLDPAPVDTLDSLSLAIDPGAPDLVVTSSLAASASAGTSLPLIVTVTNRGARATGVELEAQLSGATIVVGTSSLPVTLSSPGDPSVVRATVGALATGASASWRLDVNLPCPQVTLNPTLRSTASARLSGVPTGAAANANAAIDARPDLSMAFAAPATARPGETASLTATITNIGCAPSAGGSVNATWGADVATGSPARVSIPPLAPGQSATLAPIVLNVRQVQAATSNVVLVDAALSAADGDSDASNNSARAAIIVRAAPDVAVTAPTPLPRLDAGQSEDVTCTVDNLLGSTAATGVVVTLSAQDPTLFAGLSPSSITLPILAVGPGAPVTFRVTAASTIPGGSIDTPMTCSALVAGDANTGNNDTTFNLPLGGTSDLSVSLVVQSTPSPAEAGALVSVEATVLNHGTATAQNPGLRIDVDPAVLGNVGGAALSVTLPALAPDASTRRFFQFVVANPLPAGVSSTLVQAVALEPADASLVDNVATKDLLVDSSALVDVAVALTLDAPDPLGAGDSILATFRVSNTAARPATGVTLRATWPAALAAPIDSTPAATLAGGSASWSGLTIAALEPGMVFTLRLDLSATLPAIANTLRVSAALVLDPIVNPQTNLANDTAFAEATARAAALPCITLTATTNPTPAAEGGSVTYDVTVTNDGTTAAAPALVSLSVDPRLSTTSGTQWTLPRLEAGLSTLLTSRFTLPTLGAGETTAMFTARASVTAPQANPPDACQATSDVDLILTRLSDLTVRKALVGSSDMPPRRGSFLDYRLTVMNLGSQPATIDRVIDDYPNEVSVVSAGSAIDSAGALTWSGAALPILAPLASIQLDYRVQVGAALPPGNYVLRNVATVVNAGADASASNDSSSVDVSMPLDVDLSVQLTATPQPAPAIPGSPIAYSAIVTNRGAYPATNSRLSIDLGSLATISGPSPGTGIAPIDVTLGTINPGQSVTVNWLATSAPIMSAERNAVTVTATATSDLVDARPGDESATVTTWVDAAVDLDVHVLTCVSAGGPPLSAGERMDCSTTVENHGTLIATAVVVDVDFDSADLNVIDAGAFTAAGGSRLTLNVASLAPGAAPLGVAFSLGVLPVLASTQNPVRTCVSASSSSPDRFLPDNTRCDDDTALAAPDIQVTLTASTPTVPAAPGQAITYDLSVANVGSTAATGVTVVDDRDESLTTGLLVGATPSTISDDGTKITIPVGALAAGATFTARYQVGIAAMMPQALTNVVTSACATLSETDSTPADDCASATISVRATIDTRVSLAAVSAMPTAAGQRVTLSATWGSQGAAPARSAQVDVTLSPLVDFASCVGCTTPTPSMVRFMPGDLATPSSGSATFDVIVKSPLPAAFNQACFGAAITHADPTFESGPGADTDTLCVDALAAADLAVSIARTSAQPAPSPAPGSALTYRVTWTNSGSTGARGVSLAITDPDFTTPVGLGSDAVLSLADVTPGATGAMDLSYLVAATFPSTTNTLTASVAISTTTAEAGPGANAASWSDVLTARPNMWSQLTLSAPTNPAAACAPVTATLAYGNSGQAAAPADLRLEYDQLVLNLVDAGGGTGPAGELNWSFPSLAAGFSGTIVVQLGVKCVLPSLVNPLFATSRIVTSASDLNPADDSSLAQIIANAAPDLIVSVRLLSATPSPAGAGSVLLFESSVENAGSTRATSVQLDARWEDPALIASATCADDPTCVSSGNVVSWSLGAMDVAPGTLVSRRLSLQVAATLPAVANTLTLTSTASALEPDADASTNSAAASTTITGRPDLRLTLTGAPLPGQDITPDLNFVRYTYAIRNVGNAPAQNVSLSADFDNTALVFLFATGGGTASGNQLTFPPIASLAPNTSVSPVRAALFSPNDLAPPPVARSIAHAALVQEAPPLGLSRDANAADNSATLGMRGCYLDAYIQSTAVSAICMGSSVSLSVKTDPNTGLSYAWSVDGSLGSFTTTTTAATTYTPPVTAADSNYRVHCVVTHVATGCQRDAMLDIFTTTTCTACGCRPNPVKVRYASGTLSRVDRAGDRSVAESETVAFTVRVTELNMSRTSTLLAGRTTMSFGRGGTGPRYTATLANDTHIECGGTSVLEFTASQVPLGLVVGGVPTTYRANFSWVMRDACGSERTDGDDSGGDLITVSVAALRGADPGITFTDWGPSQGR